MSSKVLHRSNPIGFGLEKCLQAIRSPGSPEPISTPSSDVEVLKTDGDSFTFDSFTVEDAWELGHLLHAKLLPHATVHKQPTVVSISLTNSNQVLFQAAVGSGSLPDNEHWVRRKRNTVCRWHKSSWLLHCRWDGDEERFARMFGMSAEQAGNYAIHGGGVPIRVHGVEGIVAVVVVSGLKQHHDHGVICDVIKENWK